VLSGGRWKWTLTDTKSGATFCWIYADAPTGGAPAGGPHLTLTPKEATLPDGTQVELQAKDFRWTDEALRLAMEKYESKWGRPPPDLSGLIAWDNLGNFQWEYAKLRDAGMDSQAAGNEAARKISFGRARIDKGYGNIKAQMDDFGDVEIADGKHKGETVKNVPQYVYIEATPTPPSPGTSQ
jgi:hypothetical protein